jgi:hypothetical protein
VREEDEGSEKSAKKTQKIHKNRFGPVYKLKYILYNGPVNQLNERQKILFKRRY